MQYFVDMTLSLTITTGQRMLGNREIGNEAGKCRSDSIPRMTYPFCEEGLDLLQGQNFVQAIGCVKFSMFEFVRHEARSK